jgi:3-hydroxyisobutyrate dehydrogenase-like beta-hydroxyacid dehydrogenase
MLFLTIISNDAAIKEITEGDDGIAKKLKEGGIHVSMSTISPQTVKHYLLCISKIKIIISLALLRAGLKQHGIKN